MLKVMISSTVIDLPEHREEAKEACLRQQCFPKMMEHLPALPEDAVKVSLRMVNECDIYILILGHRYGSILKNHEKSITHLEYECSMQLKKPCHIFLMGDEHLITSNLIEKDSISLSKLINFKEHLKSNHIIKFFNSPLELRAELINTLSYYYHSNNSSKNVSLAINPIPEFPEAYIAHPYTLLHESKLIGRLKEYDALNRWAFETSRNSDKIFLLVAIGGMGKSALTWRWAVDNFVKPTKEVENKYKGFIWWSFYESDASFNNFIIYSLAYFSSTSIDMVQNLEVDTREELLLSYLAKNKTMIVLDGIERILRAYGKLDASGVPEEELDVQTNNNIVSRLFNSEERNKTPEKTKLRRFVDSRSALFFLTILHSPIFESKFLISSRLIPSSFEDSNGFDVKIGCRLMKLSGLTNEDAILLWKNFRISGSDFELIKLFNTFDNYPMLISILASEIATFRKAPGDFAQWKKHNPNFNPYGIPLIKVKSHILKFAFDNLSSEVLSILKIIAAFRSPVPYETIYSIAFQQKDFLINEIKLDEILSDLESRGLIGWNKGLNRYDLHPIVRGVIWEVTGDQDRINVFKRLEDLFQSMPNSSDWRSIATEEDLATPIDYFYTLVSLNKFNEAYQIFYDRINKPTHYILNCSDTRIKLLELFFPEGIDNNSVFNSTDYSNIFILNSLALSYNIVGETDNSQKLYKRLLNDLQKANDKKNENICQCNLAESLLSVGRIYLSENAFRDAIGFNQKYYDPENEYITLFKMSKLLLIKGEYNNCKKILEKALSIIPGNNNEYYGLVNINLALANYHLKKEYLSYISIAKESMKKYPYFRHKIYIYRILSTIYLFDNKIKDAGVIVGEASLLLRKEKFHEEELNLLIITTGIELAKKNLEVSNSYLSQIEELLEFSSFPIQLANFYLLKSRYFESLKNINVCLEFAKRAFDISIMDGKDYCFEYGISQSRNFFKKYNKNELKNMSLNPVHLNIELTKINVGTQKRPLFI